MSTAIFGNSLRLATGNVKAVSVTPEVTLHWLLRVGCAACFIGHGAWGVITKAGWLPFYAVFGIPPDFAWKTMPLVGSVDIVLGLAALFFPVRALFAYLAAWALFTALLRPLAGLGWWEFLERAGNYGPPIALLVIARAQGHRWLERVEIRPLSRDTLQHVSWVLRLSIALLLIGHGGFALFQEKKQLIEHWRALGVPANVSFLHVVGALELGAALLVLVQPSRTLLLAVAYWKVGTELLYPIAGQLRDGWEWLERGGDYVAPLALLCVLALLTTTRESSIPPPLPRASAT